MGKGKDQTREEIEERVSEIAKEVLIGASYFLVDVEVRGHWGTRVVEVFVDGDEEFGLDDLAQISREMEFVMDVEDTVDGSYKLELSSPGADRPLMHMRQFQKNVGRTLTVTYATEAGEEKKVEGELLHAEGEEIELDAGEEEPSLLLKLDDINEAKVALPW